MLTKRSSKWPRSADVNSSNLTLFLARSANLDKVSSNSLLSPLYSVIALMLCCIVLLEITPPTTDEAAGTFLRADTSALSLLLMISFLTSSTQFTKSYSKSLFSTDVTTVFVLSCTTFFFIRSNYVLSSLILSV